MRKSLVGALTIACWSAAVLAQQVPALFVANVLIVRSHDEIAKWVVLDPAKRTADAGHLRKVTRGMKLYMPVVATFSDSQVGQIIDLHGYVQLISPSGNTLLGARCFANQVDPRAPRTIVLEPVYDVTFDKGDPSGDYRIRASIHRGREVAVVNETIHLE